MSLLFPRHHCAKSAAIQRALLATCAAALVTLSGSLEPVSAYTRGRVSISNNTVVTDQGTLLRGGDLEVWQSTHSKTHFATDAASYTMYREQGLNTVRLAVILTNQWGADYNTADRLPNIARAVDLAGQAGLYIVIDYHDCGSYDKQHLVDFWTQVAPIYKNRTHVLYELANEPVSWEPESYTAQNIADQQEVYALIRRLAPNTHIILISVATANDKMLALADKLAGIDWSNASFGYHSYHFGSGSGIRALKAKYPCINTELTPPNGKDFYLVVPINGDTWSWIKWQEDNDVSWFCWFAPLYSSSQMAPILADAQSRGYSWTPDNFGTAVDRSTIPKETNRIRPRAVTRPAASALYNVRGQLANRTASDRLTGVDRISGVYIMRSGTSAATGNTLNVIVR